MGDSGLEGRRRVDSLSSKPGQSFEDVQPETTAAFSNAKSFAYPPLYLRHPAAFRLLDLHPGDEGDRIKCTLRQAIRTTNVRWRRMCYSALSYTWGDELAEIPITVNESTFLVTPNLAAALEGLRNNAKFGGKSRTLWIDAICINQADVNEKNHQVAQMQEIYAGAKEVIVWLGPADSTIELAVSFIHDLCNHVQEYEIFFGNNVDLRDSTAADFDHAIEKVTTNLYQQKWCAVVEMLLKPWWTRVWVIQELASARGAILQCGKLNLPWAQMALVIQILRSWHPSLTGMGLLGDFYDTEDKAIIRAAEISSVRTLFRLEKNIGFERLIDLSQLSQCKDPRDKVYALLGLTPPNVKKIIQPDYNRPIAWIFAIVIKAHVHCHENLNILGKIQDGAAHHMFPSWAVDLNINPKTKTRRLAEYNDDHQASGLGSVCAAIFSEDLLSLYAEGFILDSVDNSQVQGYREIFEWDHVLRAMTHNLSAVVSDLENSGGIQNSFKSQAATPSECLRRGIEGTLYQTITAGYLWNSETSKWDKTPIEYPSSLINGITSSPLHTNSVLGQAQSWTPRRTLILTHERMLGLAPSSTRHGDSVCIIFGLNMPAILRARGDGTWTFVGPAYIAGLMEGQALAGLEEGIYTKRMFEMR